ncbi:MAG: type I restriction endonuclease subunit R, partial [Bacteroidales bacterium]|nr:type I restriction endonuclease subunit R [Bacteroidales bacterium]
MGTNKYGLPDEEYLEESVVEYLTQNEDGRFAEYRQIDHSAYDKELCIIPDELVGFLKDTQPKAYEKLVAACGSEDAANKSLFTRLDTELKRGTLSVLRDNVFNAGYGAQFKLVYFKPVSGLNPEHIRLYNLNRLAVVRQLQYSKKKPYEIDLALFVNGLPIATIELKNALTGQTHLEAIKQYMTKRPVAGEKLLEFKRCLVHFAVGTEEVYMTTRLADEKTRFFPFNKCYQNIGVESKSGYRTAYLWEDVLRRDSLLDLLQNYIEVQVNEEKVYNDKTGQLETRKEEALIFPRYHQRRAVQKLVAHSQQHGAGHRYLIQHSAGSGKSNTIAWLAFRLASLYQKTYTGPDKAVFDSVIVVTDRRALDKQLGDNISQFAHISGEVERINENKTSQDLKKAIESRKKIIVTTLQKFPVIADSIQLFPERRYAVIIDEAHSSQSGEDARQMRKALSLEEAERFDATEEQEYDREEMLNAHIEAEIRRKGMKGNVSFYAFTATPKDKTIELFCEREHGTKEPFDLYSMEEAIKEGFIRDVLESYTSFKRYYKLVRDSKTEDKFYEVKKAVRLLSSYVDLQDTAIERKSRIMLDQFVSQTQNKIQGTARAMLVTRSRLHAVRYKLKFDEIMQEMRLPYRALVAFSGTVKDSETGGEYTEAGMNNLQGKISIPEALKLPKYRILIVANKYQTGFDEPLLHTMFVDKKLGGTNTVQTLSRLNRTKSGKESTMILDFVNDPEKVREDFQKFYGKNYMEEANETDPNSLYDVQSKVRDFKAFTNDDVDAFASIFFDECSKKELLNNILDRVCDRVVDMDDERKDLFRKTCKSYCNIYKFLCQIITFTDVELEKWYVFLTALIKKLPYAKDKLPYEVLNESELESYKLQYQFTAKLGLDPADNSGEGMKPGDALPKQEEMDLLSNIIKKLNDTFGLDLTDEDKVELRKLKDRITANNELMAFFNEKNTRDNIKDKFSEEVDAELLEFINSKLDLYNKLTEDKANTMFKTLW